MGSDFGNMKNRILAVTASGFSMAPLIMPGTRISIDVSGKQEYRPGDIAAYIGNNRAVVAHRVLRIIPMAGRRVRYLLKGDNNAVADRQIRMDRVIGKAVRLTRGDAAIDLRAFPVPHLFAGIAFCSRVMLAVPSVTPVARMAIRIFSGAVLLLRGVRPQSGPVV